MHYSLTTLDNGVRVITETMPEVRSLAIGCWVDTGTRDELPNEAGAAHFLEHQLFKGSERLSARDIAEAFDAVGARSNAFTSKEETCYWARMRDDDLALGMELLGEMLQRPAFRPHEVDSEKHVVLEEINMNEDDPTDVAYEEFMSAVWHGHDLERPVLGTRESIAAMTPEDLRGYWGRRYHASNVVVAVAGNATHEDVVALTRQNFGEWHQDDPTHNHGPAVISPRVNIRRRDTEQTHLVLGCEGIARGADRRFALGLLNHVVGGGMSSRLFREIREERGLAYAVYAFSYPHADTGAYGVYVGTTPTNTHTVLDLVKEELDKVAQNGITMEELDRSKGHVQGSLALSSEDPNGRMTRLGRREISGQEHLSVDQMLARYEAVTLGDVADVAADLYRRPRVIGAVGPFDAADLEHHVGAAGS